MKKYPQLLTTALGLFHQQGFHATGVDQLAAEAGLTKKTLYRYFATKEALIDATLQLRDDDFMAALDAFVAATPLPQRPQAYLGYLAQWFAQPDFHGCLFINAAAEYPQADDAIHRQAAAHKARLRDWLQQCCAAAGLAEPVLRAQQLFLLGEGLTVAAQVSGVDAVLLQAVRQQVAAWPYQDGAPPAG